QLQSLHSFPTRRSSDLPEARSKEQETDKEGGDDAPIVRFVNKMLLDAIKAGSSDIHFEPYEKRYRVRYRTDGVLHEVSSPPVNLDRKSTRLNSSHVKIS